MNISSGIQQMLLEEKSKLINIISIVLILYLRFHNVHSFLQTILEENSYEAYLPYCLTALFFSKSPLPLD